MSFNEKTFQQLVEDTRKSVIALGTTSKAVLDKHRKFAEQITEYLKSNNTDFNKQLCLRWVDSMKHDPAAMMTSSYVTWIAFRRYVILLSKQQAGDLNHWTHYNSRVMQMPDNPTYCDILHEYGIYLSQDGFVEKTVKRYVSSARKLLLYIESEGINELKNICNESIAKYFTTSRFENRKPVGVTNEISELRKFIHFLQDKGYSDNDLLHYALPHYHIPVERIVTTVPTEIEKEILTEHPERATNKREKAIYLLALRLGLRSCDIRNLRFDNIDWKNGILMLRQSKTAVDIRLPIDNETQNAIIDYILHERRKCHSEYIFITAVGPAQKISRHFIKFKYRVGSTELQELIPHDGLHILRRTYASNLLRCGTPLPMISEMLGHIRKNSVQHYLSTDEIKMKRCALDLQGISYQGEDF